MCISSCHSEALHVCLGTSGADREVNPLFNPSQSVSPWGAQRAAMAPVTSKALGQNTPLLHDAPQKGLSSLGITAMLRGIERNGCLHCWVPMEWHAHTQTHTRTLSSTPIWVGRHPVLTYGTLKGGTAHHAVAVSQIHTQDHMHVVKNAYRMTDKAMLAALNAICWEEFVFLSDPDPQVHVQSSIHVWLLTSFTLPFCEYTHLCFPRGNWSFVLDCQVECFVFLCLRDVLW